ncbi:LLM class flavin-dependent oxidoreductase [Microbacterium marinilacus]|uniref:LLM class flavin-dependent oxidoreductase n=1 Tax=Microbacterium marinilacus TaxID=415209 RepID=A0ABP7BR28_9MICO|nr:LLM class flavin-dependent oxidoreductase [Microbacterium marinilacus]MBY0689236.1 LLM class flavin-dependent oxidoreductase [Microbacterium marinilacus]
MRFGYWTPIFGGWLRNVEDEGMPVDFGYAARLARFAEQNGFDVTLVPELNLNDIKGVAAPSLEAWTVATALAAVTERIEIMTAIRPGFHLPAVTAKQVATLDQLSGGRFTLNVVSAWWEQEARQYGGIFSAHDDRYARTEEFVDILRGMWERDGFDFAGDYYRLEDAHLQPKPASAPTIYAGGESPAGKAAITRFADAYLTHGGTPDELRAKIAEMTERRAAAGLAPFAHFGMAAYIIVRDTDEEAQAELDRITDVSEGPAYESYTDFISKSQLEHAPDLRDYSVSNRGLRPDFVGTPERVAERILEFQDAGVDTLLLQASPQQEELERIARDVIPLVNPPAAG